MYFMKYFPTVAPTKSHLSISDRTSWKCLATRYNITDNILSFWSHSQAKGRYVSRCPNSYAVVCSLKLSSREWRVRAGGAKCVTLHKYIKATALLNNGWVASLIIQHGDQLCDTRVLFLLQFMLRMLWEPVSWNRFHAWPTLTQRGHLPVTSASDCRTCCFSCFSSSVSSCNNLYRWSSFLSFSEDPAWKQIS